MDEFAKFETSKEIFDYYNSITPKQKTKLYIVSWVLFVCFIVIDIISIIVMAISQNKIKSTPVDFTTIDILDKLNAMHLAFTIILILGIVFLIASIFMILGSKASMKEKHIERVLSQMPSEIKTRYEDLKQAEEYNAIHKAYEETQKHPEYIITKTVIIGQDSTKSTSSTITRGIIGGALLGDLGAMAGMLSAKNKQTTTFLVIYKDGHRETKEVENGSQMYNIYISYLDV